VFRIPNLNSTDGGSIVGDREPPKRIETAKKLGLQRVRDLLWSQFLSAGG